MVALNLVYTALFRGKRLVFLLSAREARRLHICSGKEASAYIVPRFTAGQPANHRSAALHPASCNSRRNSHSRLRPLD